MKVHCYFDPIDTQQFSRETALIELWKESWSRHGWQPVILGKQDAVNHRFHEAIVNSDWLMLSVNPRPYVQACYRRWMAYANQRDPLVFHSDYDVMNYGFTPADAAHIETLTCLDPELIPSVIAGPPSGFDAVVRMFRNAAVMRYAPKLCVQDDISDMNLFRDLAADSTRRSDVVRLYGREGWDTAKLVHFAHAATEGADRVELIRRVR